MNYKMVLIVVVQLFTFAATHAQENFKLAGFGSVFYPQAEVKNNTENQAFSIIEHKAFLNIPYIFKNEKTIWINGLGYSWLEIDGKNLSPTVANQNEKRLHAISYQTTIMYSISQRWNIVANLKPTLATDFEEKLSFDDFVLQGVILVTRTINKQFKIGGGLLSNMRFGQPFLLPGLSLNYKKGKHSFDALLPIQSVYKYAIGKNERLNIGLRHVVNGGEFNLSGSNSNHIPSIDKISYTRVNLGAMVDYNITKILNIDLYAGLSMRRQYDLNDTFNEIYDFNIKNSPFIQLGITLIPPKKK